MSGAVAPTRPCGRASRRRAWAELLRLPALFTVPGDALAGAAATSAAPGPRTLLAIGSSLCLYEAGMALNDWADREEDAAERPHRPLPSGRIHPAAALTAACALTGAGLALAARAGRPALAVAAPLAATVWAYDLALKHTPAGPPAMAAARGLDLLLGAAATTGRTREALSSAALLGTHTLAVTAVSRRETTGGSPLPPLAALATTAALARLATRRPPRPPAGRREAAPGGLPGTTPETEGAAVRTATETTASLLRPALAAAYAATAARPYLHATLNPSPPLTQRAVSGGIRATIPLQAALTARAGGLSAGLLVAALAPLGRRFARTVSIT
ncbi:SCO3242 family prenyltransferase [Streptomyces sp. NBC_00588]|uniref:SCO3242 family prenyltransferase n=1 Tax=Streptomyces sp. NBC_00588 TaxID=2975784 RepID=UPI002E80DEE9|nr:UbiA family prenyltransferase [Streptomyces sp. NBC_00588]WUB34911.1 UbiA family prenyltransferase [Streptomyces sp. NBC_00588]